jgi:hypothetical protein
LNVGYRSAWNQQEASIKKKRIIDKSQNEIPPFVNFFGLTNVLNQRNDASLKTAFIWRQHIVRCHDVTDGCKHAFVTVLLKFFANNSVQKGGGNGFDPCWDKKKIYVRVGCFEWEWRLCSWPRCYWPFPWVFIMPRELHQCAFCELK